MASLRTSLQTLLSGIILFCSVSINSTLNAQEVTVLTEDFPPYNYMENNVMKGISTEILDATFTEAGLTPKFQLLPWIRAYKMASSEPNLLIYSISRVPDREDNFYWIGPISSYHSAFYKLASRDDIKINTLEDAKEYTIGCSRGDVITEHLETIGFTSLDQVTRDSQNLRRLLRGRIDLLAYAEASLPQKVMQENLSLKDFKKVHRIEGLSGDLYMAFKRGSDPSLVLKLQQGFSAIKHRGMFDVIQRKYQMFP